jgi:sulfur carrier protein ThiS
MAIHQEDTSPETITVKIGALGSAVTEFEFPQGITVAEALEKAGYPSDAEVRVDGETFKGTDVLEDGNRATVLSGAKVKGA